MEKKIDLFFNKTVKKIKEAKTIVEINTIKLKYLGKNSIINNFFKKNKNLINKKNLIILQKINKIKKKLIELYKIKKYELEKCLFISIIEKEKIDLTLPGYNIVLASKHPLNQVIDEISQLFKELGYNIIPGVEVDNDKYNFKLLNLPLEHPARDMQSTFYISKNILLRTHCTNMTARSISKMKNKNEIIANISIGNTYRRDDDDPMHSHQFMQIDGFLISPNINFSNLKWTIQYFCKRIFNKNIKIRLRPSFFPFTEPSIEVDIICVNCFGVGCLICKKNGWIEIMGAGMINPLVYKACKQDSTLTGFAFGIGIERIAMLKYKIDDIRYFYINDIHFLKQFKKFN